MQLSRGVWRQQRTTLLLWLTCSLLPLLAFAPDAAGRLTTSDIPALRSRLQKAVERYQESETMDCAYPNKKQWWTSLSPDSINIV